MIKFYQTARKCLTVLLVFGFAPIFAQQVVSGKVTSSDDGSPLPGVNILEKGTTNGTVTDGDGSFKISVGANAVLDFSFIGYITQEITVGNQTTINVVLQADVTALQEVVVVGYGEVKRKDATGAVVNIGSKDFNKGVLTSPQDLLVGKFAGVAITSSSGAPGAGSTIRIRGGSSLSASNDPLIVIDGFPVDNGGVAGVSNGLASINPNDIETFTVLKDASATAIYGSRASNGVIIVTTKKGKSGKPKFSYNPSVSVSSPIKYMDVFTGNEYRSLITTLAQTGVSGLNPAAVALLGNASTDWQREIFRDAISHDHNLSAEGSLKNIPYRISYGFTDQQGILKNTGLQRNSLNINVSPSLLNDQLKLNISLKGSIVDNNFGDAGAVGAAISMDPTQPVRDGNTAYGGYYTRLRPGQPANGLINQSSTGNPVALVEQTDNKSTAKRFIGNFQADYVLPFLKEVKVTLNAGMDQTTSEGANIAPLNAGFTANTSGVPQGRRNNYSATSRSMLLDLYANYTKEFNLHKIDFTAGYGWQKFYRENYSYNRNFNESLIFFGPQTNKSENYLVSFFGRLNYTFNGKYLLTATLRNDGSSRFAKENRWGLFPSVAAAWKVKEEAFLSDVNFLSDLKLRVGYGITGQQDISDNYYPYLAIYSQSTPTAQYQLGNQFYPTLRPEAYDANIKWESTETINAGIDFGFFQNKITGSLELYQRKTSDLLNRIPIPGGTNFSNFLTTNVGNLENQGIEIQLNATAIEREDFSVNIGFNAARNINKITKLTLVDDPRYTGVNAGFIAGGVGNYVQNQQVGNPINSFYVHQQVYDAAGKPIEGLYVDRSGNGGSVVGSDLNRYRYQKPAADVLFGINSRVTYKKFDFSFSGRLSIGNYVYNNNLSSRAFYTNLYKLDFFSNVPRALNDTKFNNAQYTSDYYLSNASFFKMDNMSFGYSFDKLFIDKLKARVSLTVQNAFIITDYTGMDPEVDGGIDNNIYPRSRVILLGVNFSF
ncbi:MAG: SusC/RagA family TonB-linked outer membrane protein [Cyclobacteriaceae bacterium]|jgi:TonB-linked SusC/RagA family outer membrane protein|nr:TonB-dependent receptor [Flammeovirgaceae bacterium]